MQLTWQSAHGPLLVGTLLREPKVVEPLDDFLLQVVRHAAHAHVGLHSVQLGWEKNIHGNFLKILHWLGSVTFRPGYRIILFYLNYKFRVGIFYGHIY